jgi:type I restriction enzyme M protein
MAIKKSELYSSLWASCDELRGGMDASQYKDYVLVLLFVKYVSDKYAGLKNPLIVVPKGGSFADMVALKGQKDIGDRMNKIISKLAEANDLKGVIDLTDFNDEDKLGKGKDMQDRLSNLVAIFENPALDFSRNRAEGDDLLGDAYEYLMRHFATESGKSKGQFYTPAEVSIVMAKVIGIGKAKSKSITLYDPTCGSGSLLLKAADESHNGVSIYGQEMDNATSALAKMNMILHDNPTAVIWKDNTLSTPHFTQPDGSLKTFDFVVANFPFSNKAWSTGFDPEHDRYGRFEDGIPPKKNGDYAFLLHILRSMKSTGQGAVILPHGVLFRGGAEGEIRKNIIRKGYIKGIIGLPANLFYGTGIPACIIVLDKENAAGRKGIFMINASQGFMKDGNKNRLRHQDIHKIVDVFARQLEIPKYSRMVPLSEISDPKNDYNLNIPRYIDNTEEEDVQDIAAHLLGGIPDRDIERLAAYWDVFKTLRGELFAESARPGYSKLSVETQDIASLSMNKIKSMIFSHPEFVEFAAATTARFKGWTAKNRPLLSALKVGSRPKALIETLSEDLLATFAESRLIDPYDLYQHLMAYWTETMQDDVYMISVDGWKEACKLRFVVEEDNKKSKEKADLVIGKLKYKADLIPPALIVARYLPQEQKQLDNLTAEAESFAQQMGEMKEEHGGEEGLLEEVIDDKGKISKGTIAERLKEIKDDPEAADERKVLDAYLALIEQEAEANKKVKEAQKALDEKVRAQYAKLSEQEIKALVIDDKWLATLAADVDTQTQAIASQFAARIKELAERYASPMPQLTGDVETLTAKVDAHLQKMGFAWK